MFVFTLGKNGLRRVGALAVAGVALAGVVFATGSFIKNRDDAALAAAAGQAEAVNPAKMRIENAAGIEEFFKAYGTTVDVSSSTVDKVKIPKKWDESFSAFNTVVKESGFDLTRFKGKTVEKWVLLSPDKSTGEEKVSAVLLVYKEQPVGAYLVAQPSGEVTGLPLPDAAKAADGTDAQKAALPLTDEEAAANADFGADAPDAAEVAGATTDDFDLASVGDMPIE